METINFALIAKLREQLKKAKADKEKFENERENQEYHLELKSKQMEMEIQILQKQIDALNIEGLEKRAPKYFKLRPRNENMVMDIYKTRGVGSDGSSIFLRVDKVALYRDVDLGETKFSYCCGTKLFVAFNINDALNVFDTNCIEITEEEYNELKKQAMESLADNEAIKKA